MNSIEETSQKRIVEMELMFEKLNDFIGSLSLQTIRLRSELNRLRTEFDNPQINAPKTDNAVPLYDRAMVALASGSNDFETAAFRDGYGINGTELTIEKAGTIQHLHPQSGGFGGVMPDAENFRKTISDDVKSSAKLLENIWNSCEQLNKKVEESTRT